MNYKFIDIGCSYFDTSVDKYGLDVHGILVEPIEHYAELLPKSSTVFVEQSAIANHTGVAQFNACIDLNIKEYYTKERITREIHSHNEYSMFKEWYEGGQSSFIDGHNINAKKITVNTLTLRDLFNKYNVTSVDVITFDTEGYDLNLLKQLISLLKDGTIKINEKIVIEYYPPLYSVKQMREFDAALNFVSKEYGFNCKYIKEHWNVDMVLTKRT